MTGSLPRFFLRAPAAPGDRIALEPEEVHHARVRRLARGDRVALFDGSGRSYTGTVDHSSTQQLDVLIDDELPARAGESPLCLILAVAMLKSDRFEWMIEKTTELGVARIRPFVSAHSLAHPSASRQTRWRTIALSAAKQCGRSVVPSIDSPCDFAAILGDADADHLLFSERSTDTAKVDGTRAQATLIVGPEGGFSDGEAERARRAGCSIATLGPRVLRAETAAIAAVVLAQSAWGDLAPAPR